MGRIVADLGDAIAPATLDQLVARGRSLGCTLVAGKSGALVDDFLADRACESGAA